MRTTLDLPDETFRQLKVQAALSGLKLKELVTQFIERGLDGKIPKAANAVAAELHSIPIAREADGSVTPYLSNAQLYAIMDAQDVAQYQRVSSENSGSSETSGPALTQVPSFSALIAAAEKGRPTLVSRHGHPCAMIVSVADGARLYPLEMPNFASYLLTLPEALETERDSSPLRGVDFG